MDASSPRRAGTHTRGIGAAARTRARFARSRGRRPRASREARRSRSSWVSRSGGAVHPSIGTVPGYLESGRCRAHTRCATTHTRAMSGCCAVRCSGGPGRPTLRTERGPPEGGPRWSGSLEVGIRLLCGSCACLVARSCAPARAASRTATCCTARAWCRILARRRPDRRNTVCSLAEASGPMRLGTSPLPRRSHPFGTGPAVG